MRRDWSHPEPCNVANPDIRGCCRAHLVIRRRCLRRPSALNRLLNEPALASASASAMRAMTPMRIASGEQYCLIHIHRDPVQNAGLNLVLDFRGRPLWPKSDTDQFGRDA